jgi:serine/threonine protein kinase
MVALVSHAREFQPGDLIDGRYRIARKLADGGMGTVFLAEHMLIRRRLAIKLLHAELAPDRWMVQRFLNEATAAGTLGHPHIVESTDMGFTREGIPYIVFEYLEGCLLTEEIHRLGRLPLRRALTIARQVASALELAHMAQIAHLDLKGDNVFLINRGNAMDHAKLIDFGIARFMGGEPDRTPPGILMGTPEYMAPEQITSPETADGRADIYALGVLLYEMLTGHCPHEDEDLRRLLHRVVHEPAPVLGRAIPPALETLLYDGLLVKSRARRVQTMTEVASLLDALLATGRCGLVRVPSGSEVRVAAVPALDDLSDGQGALGAAELEVELDVEMEVEVDVEVEVDLEFGDPGASDRAIDAAGQPIWSLESLFGDAANQLAAREVELDS